MNHSTGWRRLRLAAMPFMVLMALSGQTACDQPATNTALPASPTAAPAMTFSAATVVAGKSYPGDQPTFRLGAEEANALAAFLPGLGVQRSDYSASWLPYYGVTFDRADGTRMGVSIDADCEIFDDGLGIKSVRGDLAAHLKGISTGRTKGSPT